MSGRNPGYDESFESAMLGVGLVGSGRRVARLGSLGSGRWARVDGGDASYGIGNPETVDRIETTGRRTATLPELDRGSPRVRIVAGRLRGRRLGPAPPGVRPTSDRVRESLFARLGDLEDARVLDLYCGTGALGIEALSRGASSLVSVDRSAKVVRAVERTFEALELGSVARVMKIDARGAIRRLGESASKFDVIFLDPPYADFETIGPVLESIVEADLLAADGVVVVEYAKRHSVPPIAGLVADSTRSYGDTSVAWLVRDPRDRATGDGEDDAGSRRAARAARAND